MGFIRLGMLVKNPFLCTICIPILPNILSTLVVPQHLNLPPKRLLCICLEHPKSPKSLTLVPQELNPLGTSSIFDKRDPVTIPIASGREGTLEIIMDEIERVRAMSSGLGNVMTTLLPRASGNQ